MFTVLLVRHADIDLPRESDDPPLNSAGRARAKDLVHVVGKAGITALFTSTFRRTKQTVEPLAASLGIAPRLAPEAPDFAKEVLSGAAGPVVLVAGHSDTVASMIAALCPSAAAIEIDDREFDNLFVVAAAQSGEASVLHMRYGASS